MDDPRQSLYENDAQIRTQLDRLVYNAELWINELMAWRQQAESHESESDAAWVENEHLREENAILKGELAELRARAADKEI